MLRVSDRIAKGAGLLLWSTLLVLVGKSAYAQETWLQAQAPDWTQYTVAVNELTPGDGVSATRTYPLRATAVTNYFACGQEASFLSNVLKAGRDEGLGADPSTYTGFLHFVIAKLELLETSQADCTGTFNVPFVDGKATDFYSDSLNIPSLITNREDFAKEMQTFGPACLTKPDPDPQNANNLIGPNSFAVSPASAPGTPGSFTQVTSHVTRDCLTAQINFILRQAQEGDAFPGSNGLPCYPLDPGNGAPFVLTKGDWDMKMVPLMRIIFLDSLPYVSPHPISPDVLQHIEYDLITVNGPPGPDSYPWTACGDNEKETGSPQDREDESGSADNFFDSIGDLFSWLFHHLILILVGLGTATVFELLYKITLVASSVLAAIGIPTVLTVQIPESENHRLMIESTRFLNNQIIIQSLAPGGSDNISSGQARVKLYLLDRFQEIAKDDFIEYNARPYHGFSLIALYNLSDFATDADVRTGARMLLRYSAAKFALGSNQGRRLVPFRRHFGAVDCIDGNPCPNVDSSLENNAKPVEYFKSFYQLGDNDLSQGLLFNGQTQQLPFGSFSLGAAANLVSAASSSFQPESLITDLAIQKSVPYLQKIHHGIGRGVQGPAGVEIYSSSASGLITAGGIEAGHAYPVLGIGNPFGPDDLGAGVPTTVMFTGNSGAVMRDVLQSRQRLNSFISFRGTRIVHNGSEGFSDNLCVWRNFACGTNVYVPPDISLCLLSDSNMQDFVPRQHLGPNWYFFDSELCFGYQDVPTKFYVVLYMICPQDMCSPDMTNAGAGFLEVIDNPTVSIADFAIQVVQNNPRSELGNLGQGCLTSGGACNGRYHTMNSPMSHTLDLSLRGHQDDSEKTGINYIDGMPVKNLDDWNFAEGDIINSQGDGVITITNPRLGTQIILDFSNAGHPCWKSGPNQPCVQD
jgi:hypothetical protein